MFTLSSWFSFPQILLDSSFLRFWRVIFQYIPLDRFECLSQKRVSRVIWRHGYNTLHWIDCFSQKRVLTGYLEAPLFSSVIIFQYIALDRLFIWRTEEKRFEWFSQKRVILWWRYILLDSIALDRFECLSRKRVTCYLKEWIQYIALHCIEYVWVVISPVIWRDHYSVVWRRCCQPAIEYFYLK